MINDYDAVANNLTPKNIIRKYTVFTIETILEQSSGSSSADNSSSEDDEKAGKIELDFSAQNEPGKIKKRSRTSFSGKVRRLLSIFKKFSIELFESDQIATLEEEFQQNKD